MNQQPFATPPRYWPPQLDPRWIRICRPLRLKVLRREQKMVRFDFQHLERIQKLLEDNVGVMILPNHAFHYDSYVMFEAAHAVGRPFHTMTAWQVFAMSNRLQRWWMQKHGCFSIDRESNDLQAFRQAVSILQKSPYPLLIFPEGEIYHTNDRVTPFREGAAAIALAAARKADRPIACVPCALKCWYLKDPTPALLKLMDRLESRLLWRPRPDLPLPKRVIRLAEGLLSLKEIEYLGHTRSGSIPNRRDYLANAVLSQHETYYGIRVRSLPIPERVKDLRRAVIQQLEKQGADPNDREQAQSCMEDLFFVIQLFSYPGDYFSDRLTIERLAETLDKFEEDVLRVPYPTIRGTRMVQVDFGEPILLPREKQKKEAVAQLTLTMQKKVQEMLDELNNHPPHHQAWREIKLKSMKTN